jgi:hypothetical protein
MTGRDYIRDVFKDLSRSNGRVKRRRHEFFMLAALDVLKELDSPIKEETLVRLVIMEAEEEGLFSRDKGGVVAA